APAGGGAPERLAAAHPSDSRPRWSSDGRLAFLSSRDGVAQVYVVDPSGAARKVTSSATAVTAFKWSRDSARIAYLAADKVAPEEQARLRRGDDPIVADSDYRYSRIYIAEASGGADRLLTRATRHVLSFDWSPDGARIAYAAQPTPRNRDSFNADLYEIDGATRREST